MKIVDATFLLANESAETEKFRVFQQGKLLGLFEDKVIREKIDHRELRPSDFVLVPLETFLREVEVVDAGFQYYRDGKRIDQYTLRQVKELLESGQTQPIDHVLLPMKVFLERNRLEPSSPDDKPKDGKSEEEPNADIYGVSK